jgi:crotonobetainyl-CoA:carnitine CoA-transferase CaiB-like acyl-CoA transferase
MNRPLEGITVVALEQAVAAPVATCRLADAGARVIKLERAEGDFARGYDDVVLGQSSYFVWINRGKESCVVDLKAPEDFAMVRRMIAAADVFVQNLAPGATGRLGLSAEALRSEHPRLVVCDISGYARGTPDYTRKAYDLLVQAEAGLAHVTGTEASGASRVGISICDVATGHAAYEAILEALFRRERTGEGAHIELSLFDVVAELMSVPYLTRRYGGHEPPRLGLAHPSIAPYGVFHMRDGDLLLAVQSDREWRTLCAQVLGNEGLGEDPRFARNVDRIRARADCDAAVQAVLGNLSVGEVAAALDGAGIAYGRVSTVQDLIAHRSVDVAAVETPAGTVEMPANPARVDGSRVRPGPVPRKDEHGDALRAEFGRDPG